MWRDCYTIIDGEGSNESFICVEVCKASFHYLNDVFLWVQVSLLTDSGDTKDDLRLPTDDNLLKQVKAHMYT